METVWPAVGSGLRHRESPRRRRQGCVRGIQVHIQLHVGGGVGRVGLAAGNDDRGQGLAGVDGAVHGRVAHHVVPVAVHKISLSVQGEITGAGVNLRTTLIQHKQPVPLDGDVGRYARCGDARLA